MSGDAGEGGDAQLHVTPTQIRVTPHSPPCHAPLNSVSRPTHLRVTTHSTQCHAPLNSVSRPTHLRVAPHSPPCHVPLTSVSRPTQLHVTPHSTPCHVAGEGGDAQLRRVPRGASSEEMGPAGTGESYGLESCGAALVRAGAHPVYELVPTSSCSCTSSLPVGSKASRLVAVNGCWVWNLE